ncbi:UspA domain protein [Desulforamulus reducens MI-1]|uniref:UspA domain protein n=1 Tax=Desulforamulus reducens (strain ATCC BAA-1160 / DSM 100696 / MI-1) TaxID=349161 RepID=A4J5N1_DESRM|nr:universal stress protein [Desulforamulus reducens]ABO50384.1 UspA domain protein [Desulforamulus reducens MI-1]
MFKHILLAVHGDEKSGFLEKVLEFCKDIKPEITLMHVVETNLAHYGYVDQLASGISKDQFINYIYRMANEKQEEIISHFEKKVREMEIGFQWKVKEGKPHKEILQELNEGSYDLLILGTKPKAPGNTSSKVKESVLRDLATSVLVIK